MESGSISFKAVDSLHDVLPKKVACWSNKLGWTSFRRNHLDATQDSSPVRRCQSVGAPLGLLIDGCSRAGRENINSSIHSLAGACIPERGSLVEPLGMRGSSRERLAGVDLAPAGLGAAVGLPSGKTADVAWPVGTRDPNVTATLAFVICGSTRFDLKIGNPGSGF